jgi:hypothetical protein
VPHLPVVLESAVEMTAAQGQDRVRIPHTPKHAGLFEAGADNRFAAGFDYTRSYEQVLLAEFGIAHTFGIALKVVGFSADFLDHLGVFGTDGTKRNDQLFDLPLVEQTALVCLDPDFLLHFVIGIQFAGQLPEALASVVQIDDLNGAWKVGLTQIPDPFGSVAHDDFLLRPAPAAIPGLQVDALTELLGSLNGACVGGRIRIANRVTLLVSSGLSEHAPQLGFARVCRLAVRLPLASRSLFP